MKVVVLDHAEPRLAAEIVELQRSSYAVEAELIGFDDIPTRRETADQVARLDLTFLGAVERGVVVGILGYRRLGAVIDIDRLAVDPSWFRRGIARSLIEDLHRREADASAFEVSTGAANTPAIALYEKLGYVREPDVPSPAGLTFARFSRAYPPFESHRQLT
jgi:ribosomal protein S18 acetylase RimI-like enzyme